MKFTADRAVLLKALGHVQGVVEKRNTIPILANVLLEAREGDKLGLRATDMEIEVAEEVSSGVSVARPGRATAPAAVLVDIVRKLPDGARVELDHAGGDAPLALRAGRYATSLTVLPVEDFPAMAEGKMPHRFSLPARALCELVKKTRFAISTEETRYYLNGIYLHVAEGGEGGRRVMRAVATDGHRLARVELAEVPEGAEGMPGVIVPRKTVGEVLKLAEEADKDAAVEVRLSETKIAFAVGDVRLTSKLIDGTFPEYERVIPKNNGKVMEVASGDFARAVERVAAISSERSRPVKLTLKPNAMTLTASSPEQGKAEEALDSGEVTYASGDLEIGFQARYLKDITDQVDGEVEFHFADGSAPTIVKAKGDDRALYVLMPMRV